VVGQVIVHPGAAPPEGELRRDHGGPLDGQRRRHLAPLLGDREILIRDAVEQIEVVELVEQREERLLGVLGRRLAAQLDRPGVIEREIIAAHGQKRAGVHEPALERRAGVVEHPEQGVRGVRRRGVRPHARALQGDHDRDVEHVLAEQHGGAGGARRHRRDRPVGERIDSSFPVPEVVSGGRDDAVLRHVSRDDECGVVGDVVPSVCLLQPLRGDPPQRHAVPGHIFARPRRTPQRAVDLALQQSFRVRLVAL